MAKQWRARVYVGAALAVGSEVALNAAHTHHLRNVLRLGPGAPVAAFNPADGEWLCRIGAGANSAMSLICEHRLREPASETALWLLFAPIRRSRLDWLIEKATELGVTHLAPVLTRHTQPERFNLARLEALAIAAAEQSERLSIPQLHPPRPLDALLVDWPREARLIVCDETGAGIPIAAALAQFGAGPAALLIGPEGGFSHSELDYLSEFSFVTRAGLGPRVLRAETAALAALSVYQAIAGDWRMSRPR
jgi:16S rRNA (uracil1498-N3)-methyltransferase